MIFCDIIDTSFATFKIRSFFFSFFLKQNNAQGKNAHFTCFEIYTSHPGLKSTSYQIIKEFDGISSLFLS